MINPIRNQKGIALIVTLMVLVLGFAVVAILFRLTTQETKLTGLEQGYTSALDAAKAGTDLFIDMIQNGVTSSPLPNSPYSSSTSNQGCLAIKMAYPTGSWSTSSTSTGQSWGALNCGSATSTTAPSAVSAFPPQAVASTAQYQADTTVTLSNNYTVYIKVIDNYRSPALNASPCTTGCFYYTVLARAQAQNANAQNTFEHADVQFVYRAPCP